jgi:hypothetical protein
MVVVHRGSRCGDGWRGLNASVPKYFGYFHNIKSGVITEIVVVTASFVRILLGSSTSAKTVSPKMMVNSREQVEDNKSRCLVLWRFGILSGPHREHGHTTIHSVGRPNQPPSKECRSWSGRYCKIITLTRIQTLLIAIESRILPQKRDILLDIGGHDRARISRQPMNCILVYITNSRNERIYRRNKGANKQSDGCRRCEP